jgi:hypothetical protein
MPYSTKAIGHKPVVQRQIASGLGDRVSFQVTPLKEVLSPCGSGMLLFSVVRISLRRNLGGMAFQASEFHFFYKPKPCWLRVYLRALGTHEQPPDPYQELLARLGKLHEKQHLASLGEYFDAFGSEEETREAVLAKRSVIYQSRMRVFDTEYGELEGPFSLCTRSTSERNRIVWKKLSRARFTIGMK